MCGSSAIHGGRLLSFACPKESNQRKRHPRVRGHAGIPARVTTRVALRGSPGAHPVLSSNWPASLPATASRLFLRALAAAERDPGRAERGSPCRRSDTHICDSTPHAVIPAKAGIHFDLDLALTPSKAAAKGGRISRVHRTRSRAMDRAAFGCRPWMACQPNPSARSEPSPQARARRRGCRFLWLLSFGQAKESNRPPWMADETHTDVSRFSPHRPKPETQQTPSKSATSYHCARTRRTTAWTPP